MLTQTHKHKLYPNPTACISFSKSFGWLVWDLTYPVAPPPVLPLYVPALPDCLLVFSGGSQLPFPGREVVAGPTAHTFHLWRRPRASTSSSCPQARQEALEPRGCPPELTVSWLRPEEEISQEMGWVNEKWKSERSVGFMLRFTAIQIFILAPCQH